jgi:hypothetical protein
VLERAYVLFKKRKESEMHTHTLFIYTITTKDITRKGKGGGRTNKKGGAIPISRVMMMTMI